jgi:hypothetical protein
MVETNNCRDVIEVEGERDPSIQGESLWQNLAAEDVVYTFN